MKNRKIILTVGCALALMLAPATVYADTAAQTSPRLGIPVVGSNGEAYANVAISRVSNYVNVRTEPNTSSGIVGKIYNNCAATILKTVDGEGGAWYQIQSGSVNGYIKAEYFITGAEAEKVAKQVGTVYAAINTDTLRLREEPNTTSATLTLLSRDAEYIATKEEGDFVQIQVDYEYHPAGGVRPGGQRRGRKEKERGNGKAPEGGPGGHRRHGTASERGRRPEWRHRDLTGDFLVGDWLYPGKPQ